MPYMKTLLSDDLEQDIAALLILADLLRQSARQMERRRMKLIELETRRAERPPTTKQAAGVLPPAA